MNRSLVVGGDFELRGLITVKDIQKAKDNPNACRDDHERLRVGAAVGTGAGTEERVQALVDAGVDVVVVDTAHGHSQGVIDRVRWVKQQHPEVQVIGGNIATAAAAEALREAGADAVNKCNKGPGSDYSRQTNPSPFHPSRFTKKARLTLRQVPDYPTVASL